MCKEMNFKQIVCVNKGDDLEMRALRRESLAVPTMPCSWLVSVAPAGCAVLSIFCARCREPYSESVGDQRKKASSPSKKMSCSVRSGLEACAGRRGDAQLCFLLCILQNFNYKLLDITNIWLFIFQGEILVLVKIFRFPLQYKEQKVGA